MRLLRGFQNLRPDRRGRAVTIGNFDGLHRGHRAVIEHLCERAAEQDLTTTVVTFEPTPDEYFDPDHAPARLQRFRDKLVSMQALDIDQVLCLRFNHELARLTAAEFVDRILVKGLGVIFLMVGDDFRFGRGREGDLDFLRAAGRRAGFEVNGTRTYRDSEERISSTLIREALARGDISRVEALLGRPYRICGRVARGRQQGRTIGFPTANIRLHRLVSPVRGVFVVKIVGLGKDTINGVANIGTQPTVNGVEFVLEAHLFDFNQDIYGRHLRVEFCKKLRDEKKFDSFELLRQQIALDVQQARQYFNQ
jgi:riboflavin kinase/FMN adenylyltransferase